VRKAVAQNPSLQWADFDGLVRQFLHAIHGVGGRDAVHDSMGIVFLQTVRKDRDRVENMSRYIVAILRKFQSQLVAERTEKRFPSIGSEQESLAAAKTGDATPAVVGGDSASKASDFEVPSRVKSSQLMDMEANREFVCGFCKDVCEDAALLPCSHVCCYGCVRQKDAQKGGIICPSCSSPFDLGQVSKAAWLTRWINNIQIYCVFADPEKLKDSPEKEDPLPARHMARQKGHFCDWTGAISTYGAHQAQTCQAARCMREMMQKNLTGSRPESQAGLGGIANDRADFFDGSTPERLGVAGVASFNQSDSPEKSERPRAVGGAIARPAAPNAGGYTAPVSVGSCRGNAPVAAKEERAGNTPKRWKVIAAFCPASVSTTLGLNAGDWVEVDTIDPSGWAHGSKLAPNGAAIGSGWFPAWSVGLDVTDKQS
jgi:hypothetical protein